MGFPWFGVSRDDDGRRHVELMLGPADGAVLTVGPDVNEMWTGGGRYAPVEGESPDRFYWDTGRPV